LSEGVPPCPEDFVVFKCLKSSDALTIWEQTIRPLGMGQEVSEWNRWSNSPIGIYPTEFDSEMIGEQLFVTNLPAVMTGPSSRYCGAV
jgi:hypothetical protein